MTHNEPEDFLTPDESPRLSPQESIADCQTFAEWVQEESYRQFRKTLAALRRGRGRQTWEGEEEGKQP